MNTKRRTSKKTPLARPADARPEPGAESPPPVPAAPFAEGFPIVGIGASAGGLAAVEAFLSAMPADSDTGMAFVLVQHLAPDHKSILGDLIKRHTRMQVFEVTDGMTVKPDCAYIIPPNRDMAFLGGRLQLLEPSAPRGLRLPIDFFFRSLAQAQRERAICIVLSGTGSDGSLGVRAVKGEGGMVMAQAPETTEYDGMPKSAIATGMVDYVLPPREMPAQLVRYAAHAFGHAQRESPMSAPRTEEVLNKICVVLRANVGHDFSQYKQNTLTRRVERRMALHQIEHPDVYLRLLQSTPTEIDALFRDLLIGVTSFFRDPEAFGALQSQVLPRLIDDKQEGETVRVWVCGCSTGEEAYSLAICIHEHVEKRHRPCKVQVFATDIDRLAIEHARAGVYPASIAADVSPARLARFFSHDPNLGHYRAQKVIRDMLVFSEQDAIKDPPFSRMDLISCRNLLIYMNADLQKRLIPLFHYALVPGGALFLGTSETIGELTSLFAPVDRKWKLYLRQPDMPGAMRASLGEIAPPGFVGAPASLGGGGVAKPGAKLDVKELTERALLQHYAQAAVLINGRGDVLYIYGRTGKYLEPAPGSADNNILPMAREGLRRELATALHKAVASNQPVHRAGLQVKTNSHFTHANLTIRPVASSLAPGDLTRNLFLVVLDDTPLPIPPAAEPEPSSGSSTPQAAERRVSALEHELRAKDEYLQTTLEEMQTSHEELTSTNEEMQSVNEELQSTNEELETSKEELQSVNEELATVNAELQIKVTDLSRANNDMNNLLAGTGVGTLFVDHELRIARFTPAATHVINLIQSDIGRPIAHVVSNLRAYNRLLEDVQGVLETLVPFEAEVQTRAGEWYLMRIRPYRTLDNVIEGAVLTFIEISERRRVQEALRENEDWLRLALEAGGIGTWWIDFRTNLASFSPEMDRILGHVSLGHQPVADALAFFHPEDLPRVLAAFEAIQAAPIDRCTALEARVIRGDGEVRWLSVSARVAFQDTPEGLAPVRQTVVCADITHRKQ